MSASSRLFHPFRWVAPKDNFTKSVIPISSCSIHAERADQTWACFKHTGKKQHEDQREKMKELNERFASMRAWENADFGPPGKSGFGRDGFGQKGFNSPRAFWNVLGPEEGHCLHAHKTSFDPLSRSGSKIRTP